MLRFSVIAGLLFLTASQTANTSLRQMRMTPAEIAATGAEDDQTGGAGSAAGQRRVLFGDPTSAGYYSILLFVPAHTTIQAHSHRDNRMATVVSGEWHFGYGNEFNASALKTLPPGSVYSEPGGVNHFAQTSADPVIVQISGYGPTDTHYFDPAKNPRAKPRPSGY
jgi:quercetin dioxygenase-like cupin family protein